MRDAPLVLWDPVLDGESYIQELLRINLSTQLAVYGKVQESREVLRGDAFARAASPTSKATRSGCRCSRAARCKELLPAEGHAARRSARWSCRSPPPKRPKIARDQQKLAELSSDGTFQRAIEQPFWREIKAFCAAPKTCRISTLQWMEQRHG